MPDAPKTPNTKSIARDSRSLLDRILDTPDLAQVVPRLQPDMLHQIIRSCGLEACGEIVTLATPGQLARVFDLDLWRAGQPGLDEQFDAARFGVWLEVLIESGVSVAAQTLADMDAGLVIAALARHVRVFDVAAGSPVPPGLSYQVGGYLLLARSTDSWEAITTVLIELEKKHHVAFHRLMGGCRSLSNSVPEIDGLDNLLTLPAQAMFDLASDRERRREAQGYVTPAQARAFLQMSRQLPLTNASAPSANPVARAYFRDIAWTAEEASDALAPDDSAAVAAVVDLLISAGVVAEPPRALLQGEQGDAPHLTRIQAQMRVARDRDRSAYSMRSQELAYLANAIVAGCPVQGRPFTAQEASNAAVAVCNLGLENWPSHWLPANARALADDFLVGHDLVSVFQVGWRVLYDAVGMYAAARLVDVLKGLKCPDRETQRALNVLRIEMTKQWKAGTPWRAQDLLDVIEILDMPAWATLVGLIAECPVMHAALGASQGPGTLAVSASAFEFISDNSHIASIRKFMESLPEVLRG